MLEHTDGFYNTVFTHCMNITAIISCNEPLCTKCSSNAKRACILFSEDMVIKSCIMHAHHNDIHNEHRGIVLCGGRIMMEMRLEFNH